MADEMRRLLLALCFVAISAARAAAPDLSGIRFEPHLGARLPLAAALRDETGRMVTLGAVAGGLPLVLTLGYFRCRTLCGVAREDALSALSPSGLVAGRDYRLLALSIDPSETPDDAARARRSALDRYPGAANANGWRFLTAPVLSVREVAEAAGFRFRPDPGSRQFLHPAGLAITQPNGTIASYALGIGYAPGALRSAALRANEGWVADFISPVLLLCFHYDAETGRYTLSIYRALSMMAAVTALALGGVLLAAHLRPGRRA